MLKAPLRRFSCASFCHRFAILCLFINHRCPVILISNKKQPKGRFGYELNQSRTSR